MKITVPHIPKSHNSTRGGHWSVRATQAKRWRTILGHFLGRHKPPATGRRAVKIEVYRHQLQDFDNAYASCKPVLDAVKKLGWIVDDSRKWIDYEVVEGVERRKSRQRTVISIELASPAGSSDTSPPTRGEAPQETEPANRLGYPGVIGGCVPDVTPLQA